MLTMSPPQNEGSAIPDRILIIVQCIYTSADLPCQFCQERRITTPCEKLLGPKTQVKFEAPRRLVPTPGSSGIDSEDVSLLKYVYSGQGHFTDMIAFSTALASVYGTVIPFPSLRHAILSFATLDLPSKQFRDKSLIHKGQALRHLNENISDPERVHESDLFASCLLAMRAWESGEDEDLSKHILGCLAILDHLNNRPHAPSHALSIFAPFVTHWMDYLRTVSYVSRWPGARNLLSLPPKRISFKQRVLFFKEFCRVATPKDAWLSGVVEALHDILTDLVLMLTFGIYGVATKEAAGDFQRDTWIEEVLRQVDEEYTDLDLQRTLRSMACTFPHITSLSFEARLANYQLLQLKGIQLGKTILESRTILDGLASHMAQARSKSLLSSYRSLSLAEDPTMVSYYAMSYSGNLLLASLCLPSDEIYERMKNL